jgi:predicted TIM-barrel fold metal-dependent hydrolase
LPPFFDEHLASIHARRETKSESRAKQGEHKMIIDSHGHLGNILYPGGGNLIFKKGVKKKFVLDIATLSEWQLHAGMPDGLLRLLMDPITRAERVRNETATLENLRKSMDRAGVDKMVCLPLPPNVTFDALRRAAELDPGVIPFTGVDFTRAYDISSALNADVSAGAKGLKLHPIIQKEPLNSRRVFEVVETFAPHGLPVLFHAGEFSYYLGEEKARNQVTSYGAIHYARDLVAAFPNVNFVVGHAGMFQVEDVMAMLGGFSNVYVDITFQIPDIVRKLINVFGPERVLYGSDWPWGNHIPAIKIVRKACKGDKTLEHLLFHENAAGLLGL